MRVYVSVPNRYRLLLEQHLPLIGRLFPDAEVYCPQYSPGSWWSLGPRRIRGADWFLVLVPEDGVVGRGVVEEVRLALEYHREITVLYRGVPRNVCSDPFELVDGGQSWVYHAKLKEIKT